jgi:O-antigen ligase
MLMPSFVTAHVMTSFSCLMLNLDGLNLVIAIAVYGYLCFWGFFMFAGPLFATLSFSTWRRCFLTSRCFRGSTEVEIVINVRSKRFVTYD